MVLIFGGAYQGKMDYAQKHFKDRKIINNIDKWIFELIKEGKDVSQEIEIFLTNNKNNVIILNDISCGVVPICPDLRRWREEVGRFMGVAAKQSDEVIRLFCGIPMRIK